MSFTKTLLAGAAIGALCTAPALARTAPNIHLAGIQTNAKMTVKSPSHSKTDVGTTKYTDITQTVTFSSSVNFTADGEVPILLFGETWQDTATCIPPAHEFAQYPRQTAAASVRIGTSTGPTSACPNTTFTFYGPLYTLERRHVRTDSFKGLLRAHHYSGYNLTLNENVNVNIPVS